MTRAGGAVDGRPGRWLDVSVPLHAGLPHWPGEPGFAMEVRGDGPARTAVLRLGTHTGTHLDAPRHFLSGGATVDQAPPEALVGPARVVRIPGDGPIGVDHVAHVQLAPGSRLLLKTRNSERAWPDGPHLEDHAGLTAAAARFLAGQRPALIGIDYLSVAAPGEAREVHEALLAAGVWVLEGLDLRAAPEGPAELVCLPLRIAGGDGAPARAVLRLPA